MKTKSLSKLPALQSERSLVAYNSDKTQRHRQGVVKLMPPTPPPDEKTIRELNRLASTRPFCAFRKGRRHDML